MSHRTPNELDQYFNHPHDPRPKPAPLDKRVDPADAYAGWHGGKASENPHYVSGTGQGETDVSDYDNLQLEAPRGGGERVVDALRARGLEPPSTIVEPATPMDAFNQFAARARQLGTARKQPLITDALKRVHAIYQRIRPDGRYALTHRDEISVADATRAITVATGEKAREVVPVTLEELAPRPAWMRDIHHDATVKAALEGGPLSFGAMICEVEGRSFHYRTDVATRLALSAELGLQRFIARSYGGSLSSTLGCLIGACAARAIAGDAENVARLTPALELCAKAVPLFPAGDDLDVWPLLVGA